MRLQTGQGRSKKRPRLLSGPQIGLQAESPAIFIMPHVTTPPDGTVVRRHALAFKQAGLNSEPHTYSCVTGGSLSLFESLSLPLAWVMAVRVGGRPTYGAPSPSLGT